MLVWTSISAADDCMDDDADVMDDFDDTNDVDDLMDVSDDEDTFEPSSEEGRKCLQRLIADCMTAPENEGNVEACESLATNLEVSYKLILKKPLLIQCTFRVPPPKAMISRIFAMCQGTQRLPLQAIRRPRRTLTKSRVDSTKFLIS